jgi:hypothetical protein
MVKVDGTEVDFGCQRASATNGVASIDSFSGFMQK